MFVCQDCDRPVLENSRGMWVHLETGSPFLCQHLKDPRVCCGRAEHWVHTPVPETRELERHLRRISSDLARTRVARLRFVQSQFGPLRDKWYPGGIEVVAMFEEMRLCYVEGLFVATIVMAQTYLERVLGAWIMTTGFHYPGPTNLRGLGFAGLLTLARKRHLVSKNDFAKFDALRQVRNSYVHIHSGDPEGELGFRAFRRHSKAPVFLLPEESVDPLALLEAEARWALQVALDAERPKPRRPIGIPFQSRLEATRYL